MTMTKEEKAERRAMMIEKAKEDAEQDLAIQDEGQVVVEVPQNAATAEGKYEKRLAKLKELSDAQLLDYDVHPEDEHIHVNKHLVEKEDGTLVDVTPERRITSDNPARATNQEMPEEPPSPAFTFEMVEDQFGELEIRINATQVAYGFNNKEIHFDTEKGAVNFINKYFFHNKFRIGGRRQSKGGEE